MTSDTAPTQTQHPSSSSVGPRRLTAIIHDSQGAWFAPSGLFIAALTDEELERLQGGEERLPNTLPAVNLLEVLPGVFVGNDILWS